MQKRTKVPRTLFIITLALFVIQRVKLKFIPRVGRGAVHVVFANPGVRLYFLTKSVSIGIFDDVSAEVVPRVGKDALLVIVFPLNGTKLSLVVEKEKIVVEVHETKQLNFNFLRGVCFGTKNSVIALRSVENVLAKLFSIVFGVVIDFVLVMEIATTFFLEAVFPELTHFLAIISFSWISAHVINRVEVRTLLWVCALLVLAWFGFKVFQVQMVGNDLLIIDFKGEL